MQMDGGDDEDDGMDVDDNRMDVDGSFASSLLISTPHSRSLFLSLSPSLPLPHSALPPFSLNHFSLPRNQHLIKVGEDEVEEDFPEPDVDELAELVEGLELY